MQRLFADMGGVSETQEFYRYYVFPNATHCGGAGMSTNVLFNALVDWVENGVPPDYLVAQVNATRTRKVCMYPNTRFISVRGAPTTRLTFIARSTLKTIPLSLPRKLVCYRARGRCRAIMTSAICPEGRAGDRVASEFD